MPFLAVLLIIGYVVAFLTYSGFVFSVLWGWFIVPVFHLPELTILQALGISVLVGAVIPSSGDTATNAFIKTTIVLIFGWLIHLFM